MENGSFNNEEYYNQGIDNSNYVVREKNNVFLGIIGSILGALIGSILWIILYQFDYIAAIGGLAIALCSIQGYKILGGKLNLLGILITIIVTILGIFSAEYLAVTIAFYREAGEYGYSFFECFKQIWTLFEYKDFMREFVGELAIGYGLTIIGSISYFVRSKRRNR